MTTLWLFVGAVVACLALLAWLEHRDERVLRDYLRRRYPVRLSNSFWGGLHPGDGTAHEPDTGVPDRRADPDRR